MLCAAKRRWKVANDPNQQNQKNPQSDRDEQQRRQQQQQGGQDRQQGGQRSDQDRNKNPQRSEEHTSELQSLMRISYAVFCLKKKKHKHTYKTPISNPIKRKPNTTITRKTHNQHNRLYLNIHH